jgi:hypothetical protein
MNLKLSYYRRNGTLSPVPFMYGIAEANRMIDLNSRDHYLAMDAAFIAANCRSEKRDVMTEAPRSRTNARLQAIGTTATSERFPFVSAEHAHAEWTESGSQDRAYHHHQVHGRRPRHCGAFGFSDLRPRLTHVTNAPSHPPDSDQRQLPRCHRIGP